MFQAEMNNNRQIEKKDDGITNVEAYIRASLR
jgi:hypothetical protein